MSNAKGQGFVVKIFSAFRSPITHYLLPITKKGFTLIEVLVSLAIVSGVFLLVLTSFSYHIDVFGRKQDSLRLVLRAKENLYLYRTGKLIELEGTKDGIAYEIKTEDMQYHFKKVTSMARSGRDEASLLVYVRK